VSDHDVLDAWRGRVTGDQLKARAAAEVRKWQEKGCQVVAVAESVQAQVWLAQALKSAGITCREVRPNRDKELRAQPAEVLYENGQVWHAPHLRDGAFEDELEHFPVAEHDDQVDALVYALFDLATGVRLRVRELD
jgi:predicted phage terminase large subunit-like protein